jgi:hypothetical protein
MFMKLRIPRTENNIIQPQMSRDIQTRNISNDPNTIYPFMCQTIIGSRKPCRVLTKKWSELKPTNTATGGTTSTVDSTFTNKQRYAHYSKNTQKYASNINILNPPNIRNLQGTKAYANSIELYFNANTNSYTIYTITVTDVSSNIVVQNETFRNTNRYVINRLQPTTEYNISISAVDYLGQQTIISLNKFTTSTPVDTPIEIEEPPYIPDEYFQDLIIFGGNN